MSCASCEVTQNCVTTQNCDSTQNHENWVLDVDKDSDQESSSFSNLKNILDSQRRRPKTINNLFISEDMIVKAINKLDA